MSQLSQPFHLSDFVLRRSTNQDLGPALEAALAGRCPVVIVPRMLNSEECAVIGQRFFGSRFKNAREDGVDGAVIGAYHYQKSYLQYAGELEKYRGAVDGLFEGLRDPRAAVREALEAIPELGKLRPALWEGRAASDGRALAWTQDGQFMLNPHDDIGQLRDDKQEGFEAQQCVEQRVLAINIYVNVPPNGGELRIWNAVASDEWRKSNGLQGTGFPYPEEALEGHMSIDVPVESGCMVVSDGALVHAVLGYPAGIKAHRLIINYFVGRLSDGQLVYWT